MEMKNKIKLIRENGGEVKKENKKWKLKKKI